MKYEKIVTLVPTVAAATKFQPHIVESVINHVFKSFKDFLQYPTHCGIRLPYLGVVRAHMAAVRAYIVNCAIPRYRKGLISKERLKILIDLRHLVKKDEQRRNHKQRFELKFEPAWRSGSDSVGQS